MPHVYGQITMRYVVPMSFWKFSAQTSDA